MRLSARPLTDPLAASHFLACFGQKRSYSVFLTLLNKHLCERKLIKFSRLKMQNEDYFFFEALESQIQILKQQMRFLLKKITVSLKAHFQAAITVNQRDK